MNTISIQNGSAGTMNNTHGLLSAPGNWGLRPHGSVAKWLPAPPVVKRQPARAAASANSIWLPLDAESLAEKAMLFGLALAAGIGIAYGFLCLVNLVENWAAVQASVGHLLQ